MRGDASEILFSPQSFRAKTCPSSAEKGSQQRRIPDPEQNVTRFVCGTRDKQLLFCCCHAQFYVFVQLTVVGAWLFYVVNGFSGN